MILEIEKKYLLREEGIDHATEALLGLYPSVDHLKDCVLKNGVCIRQGYITDFRLFCELVDFPPKEVRLRDKGGAYFLTFKGEGCLLREECEIPLDKVVFDRDWLKTESRRVEKVRYARDIGLYTVEFDVYTNRDLIVAEIEVPSLKMLVGLPVLGRVVTEDKRYKNRNLAR